MAKALVVNKNGMVHNEYERNEHKCTCVGCKKPIPVHMGRKIIIGGGYRYIHHSNTCLTLATEEAKALENQSNYKHQLIFRVETDTLTPHKSLSMVGGTMTNAGRTNVLYCHSLNKIRPLRNVVDDIVEMRVILTMPNGKHTYFTIEEIDFYSYQSLLNQMIINTKLCIYNHYGEFGKIERMFGGSYKTLVHANFAQCLERIKAI